MRKLNQLNDIDTSTAEGRMLIAALSKITTESQQDKQPDEVVRQCADLVKEMWPPIIHFQDNGFWYKCEIPYIIAVDLIADPEKADEVAEYEITPKLNDWLTENKNRWIPYNLPVEAEVKWLSDRQDFVKELEQLLNRHSIDNKANTPDFILASFLQGCLMSYIEAIEKRDKWFSKPAKFNAVVPDSPVENSNPDL